VNIKCLQATNNKEGRKNQKLANMYKLILHLLQTYKGLSNRSSDTSFTNDSIIGKKAPWAVKKTFASNTEVEGRYKGKDIIPSHLGKQIKSGSRSNV